MTIEIRRGLGTRRDVQILVATIFIGCLAVAWALVVRSRLEGPPKVPVSRQSREEILRLQHMARGPMRTVTYLEGGRARGDLCAGAGSVYPSVARCGAGNDLNCDGVES
ncbi:MAG: hypothetical protein N3A53_07400 [Verrucomicrobiae bacterium]|nr:hypothetical protein [Verrucomicrobiae bacterium]